MKAAETLEFDVLVVGGGPAGTAAALGAAQAGAKTALATRGAFGGMAANDGPIPVRTLAHAARLVREARQLPRYGIDVGEPLVDYGRLLARARDVVGEARAHSTLLTQVRGAGVTLYEDAGTARFVDPHIVQCETGPRVRAKAVVVCAGGISRPLTVPGADLTVTPAAAFSLTRVPRSLIVVGAGATGAQVASIFNAFGSRITLFQAAPRIVPTEDDDVSAAVAAAFWEDGIDVRESVGTIERFERAPDGGVTMVFDPGDGGRASATAEFAVCTIGWIADTAALDLPVAGVEPDARGFIAVGADLRTSAPHVFAAGDVTGRMMLVPQAVEDGFAAGIAAAGGTPPLRPSAAADPIGSFTDPEYAKVGLTEREARADRDVVVARAGYDETTRPIIDGRTRGFCKLVLERGTLRLLGCHVVGGRAVEVAQMGAIAMAAGLSAFDLAKVPLSFPTYANVFGRAALRAVHESGSSKAQAPVG